MAEGSWQFDLGKLLEDLKQVTDWFQLGLRLGVDYAELKKIEKNHKFAGVERCKAEMIAFWRDNSGDATLRKLVSALVEIGHRRLAKELQEKYKVLQTAATIAVTEPDELLNPSSDNSRELLHTKCIVNQLDKEVRREYANFAKDLQNLFERKGVSVNDAIHSFAYYHDESDLTSDMREATNIGEFLLALKYTQSWYNFDATAHLAEDLGNDEGKELVERYEAKLKVHLKNRNKAFKTRGRARQFVIKVDDKREHFTDEKVIEFRNTIVKLMKIKHKDLILKSIRKGCVEFTYLFQSTLAHEIRQAIGECIDELKKQRVISVSIDGDVVWSQQQASEMSKCQNLIRGEATARPKQLRGLLDMATRSKPNFPQAVKTRSVNLFSDGNLKSKQPFHKLVLGTCRNVILKKRVRVLLVAVIVLFLLVVFVMYIYFS